MDLLRQVLVRLPLQSIIESGLLDGDFILTRLRAVNRISEDYLNGVRGALGLGESYGYIALCTFQGELSTTGSLFLQNGILCDRAAFLRQPEWYLYLSRQHGHRDINLALASDNLEIIRSALDRTPPSDEGLDVIDPEAGCCQPLALGRGSDSRSKSGWQPELIALFRPKIEIMSENLKSDNAIALAGYLHIPIHGVDSNFDVGYVGLVLLYWKNYLRAEMSRTEDPFATSEGLDQILLTLGNRLWWPSIQTMAIEAGYFSPLVIDPNRSDGLELKYLISSAAYYVQPRLLRKLSVRIAESMEFVVGVVDPPNITVGLITRAREMIGVIQEHYPEKQEYLLQLRALCGLPVGQAEGQNHVTELMNDVAHPQLTAGMLRDPYRAELHSSIRYDVMNYFRQNRLLRKPNSSVSNRFVCIYGQLLRCYEVDQLASLVLDLDRMRLV